MLLDQERPDHLEAADGGSLLVDVLCDLFPGQETLLFHLMVCPTCRGRATSTLLARHGMTLVLPVGLLGELLAGSCRPPEPRPDLADALLAELLTHPLEHHFELVEEPRFHDAALVELLAERSRHEQPRDLELSEHLASLAGKLALQTVPGVEDRERVLVRSAALMANARRLGGRPEQAERVLAGATVYSVPLAEQALFLRVKGLVSWELGRPDEGAHHLEEAVRLFSEARAVEEEGATLTLLGLLYAEEGEASPCLGALLAGLSLLAGAQRPWLAARGCFTLAGNLADSGCREEAWGALRRGLEHAGAVEDPAEAAFLRWLEGTALGSVGEAAQARELLRQAQARYLGEGRLAEAALASLDLALVLAEAGTTLEIGRLAEELEERFPGAREAGEAATALRRTRWSDPNGLRRSVDTVTSPLRRLFRMGRHRPRPIPFV